MQLSWTGGEAGAFDWLPMGLVNDRTKKRKRNSGRDSSDATGAARKKAIVAVARQLAVDLWRIRTGRITAEQLGLTL